MQVIIMAGGEGSRLRPLTVDRPKPMTPVANQPLLEHIVRLLRRHGFPGATLTVHYRAEAIARYFGGGERWGMELTLAREVFPLGTAGGVRAAWRRGEPVLVLSGDALTDLDLSALVAYHRARGAAATLALQEVLDPTGMGVVQVAPDGRVVEFVEKPPLLAAPGRLVNTGIYVLEPEVLEMVPTDAPYDFGRNLYPRLVAAGVPVYGWCTGSYWCDAGTLTSYLGANLAALRRAVRLELREQEAHPGIWVGEGAYIDPDARLEPPVLIGDGARIEAETYLRSTVVGPGATVGYDACLEHSVVLPGQDVAAGLQLDGAIVSAHGVLQPLRPEEEEVEPAARAPA